MSVYQEINQKLCQRTGADSDRGLFTAEVTKVSGDTCSVRYGDLVFEDVRLRVIAEDSNNSRMLLTPKVGSCMLVADLSGGDKRDFERLILFVTGMQNIRDVIPFPRTPKNAEF